MRIATHSPTSAHEFSFISFFFVRDVFIAVCRVLSICEAQRFSQRFLLGWPLSAKVVGCWESPVNLTVAL